MLTAHIRKGRQYTTGETVQAAIHADLTFEALPEILEQEIFADRGCDVLPRKDFVRAALAVSVKEWVESVLFECSRPGIISLSFAPGVELRAVLPGRVDHLRHAPVA